MYDGEKKEVEGIKEGDTFIRSDRVQRRRYVLISASYIIIKKIFESFFQSCLGRVESA